MVRFVASCEGTAVSQQCDTRNDTLHARGRFHIQPTQLKAGL